MGSGECFGGFDAVPESQISVSIENYARKVLTSFEEIERDRPMEFILNSVVFDKMFTSALKKDRRQLKGDKRGAESSESAQRRSKQVREPICIALNASKEHLYTGFGANIKISRRGCVSEFR